MEGLVSKIKRESLGAPFLCCLFFQLIIFQQYILTMSNIAQPLLKEKKMSEAKTGRYSIGEEIYACVFVYGDRITTYQPYLIWSWSNEVPTDIKFIKMTVKEHHKVPGQYDEEIKYDGYILATDDGALFTNQYPLASYGQVSDRGDRIFHIDFRGKTQEDFNKIFDNQAKVPYEYVMIDEVFTPMIKAITLDKDKLPDGLGAKLSMLINHFKDNFTKQFPDMELVTAPRIFIKKDGTESSYPHILETKVVKKEKKEENV